MDIITRTVEQVRQLSQQEDACLVSFSGGKDSLVVAHLARQHFKKVVGFFFYFAPGLRCDAERLAIADEWKIELLHYPAQNFIEALRKGVYGFRNQLKGTLPSFGQKDIYALARMDTGLKLILTGMKRCDSLVRKRMLTKYTGKNVFHPLMDWANFDVLAYLKLKGIPVPPSPKGKRSWGTDLLYDSLLYLYENFPDDFQKICAWFPFAQAVIFREKWFWGWQGNGKWIDPASGAEHTGHGGNGTVPVRQILPADHPPA